MAKKCTVVLGGQWGDEGKGKLVDLLAVDADMVCRCQVRWNVSTYRNLVDTRVATTLATLSKSEI